MNQQHSSRPHPVVGYRADIDGLRAIAVTAVVLFHAGLPGVGGGFAGVDVFFVISGFLIGGIIYRSALKNSFSYANFYARRARRILPALIAVVISTLLLGLVILAPNELIATSKSSAAALSAISNFYFVATAGYFSPDAHTNPMLMTWSLGVEEQFYFIFPIILIAAVRFARLHVFKIVASLTAGSFALSIWLTQSHPTMAFYLLPTRAWELGAGVLLAIWLTKHRPVDGLAAQVLGIFGIFAVVGSLILFSDAIPFPGYAAAIPVLGSAALLASQNSWFNRVILSSKPFVGIHRIMTKAVLWQASLRLI